MTRKLIISLAVVIVAVAAGAVRAQKPDQAAVLLEAAQQKEIVEGDLAGAIKLYETIVSTYGKTNRPVAARALLRLAAVYQTLGDAQAQVIWRRIIDEFSDQSAAASEARVRVSAPRTPPAVVGPRLVGTVAGRLSSDERTIVFVEPSGEVATKDMATGKITRLTPARQPGHRATSPVLSPDSGTVAYAENYVGEADEFRLMPNQPGATPTVLFRNPEFTYVSPQAWSPDGRAVLTTMLRTDKTWQLAWVSTADGTIKVLESLEWRFDDHYDVVNLSPDGRYVAYSSLAVNPARPLGIPEQESLQRRVYVLASDGSGPKTELLRTADGRRPVWTPDSASVVFLSDLSATFGLWSVPVRGGKATIVRAGMEKDILPIAITRSGTLYYSRTTSGYPAVSIRDVKDGGARSVVVGFGPAWSPDGTAIALLRDKPRGETGTGYNLVIHSVDTGEELLYEGLRIAGASHGWFHDRKRVLVPVTEGALGVGPFSWYVVDSTNGTSSKFLLPVDQSLGPFIGLSPDDKTLYYLARQDADSNVSERLMALDLAAGQSRQVFHFSSLSSLGPPTRRTSRGPGGWRSLSPDGRRLAFLTSNDTETHLGLISLDTGRYEELYHGPKVATIGLQWTNGGNDIAWGETIPAAALGRIMSIPASGGSPVFTGLEFDVKGGQPRMSPDGRRVANRFDVPTGRELWALDGVMSRPQGPR